MNRYCRVILAGLVAVPGIASAQPGTPTNMQGAALLASCRAGEAQCGAYLQGVLDGMFERQTMCEPPRYDRERLRAAYLRWAEADTYFRDKHMVAGAERAFEVAWPCQTRP